MKDSMEKWQEAVQALRAFTWNDTIEDEKEFIEQWLALIRTAFRVDFSFATLVTQARKIEAAAPADPCGSPPVSVFVNAFFDDLSTSSCPTLVEDIDLRWGFRSLVAASLSPTGKGLSGIIAIGDCSRADFTAPELFHFQNASEELGFALRRSLLRKIFRRKKILVEVAEETPFLEIRELLANITARVKRYLAVDLCAIRLIDTKEHFWPVALSPDQSNLQYLLSPHCGDLTPRLFEKKRSVAISYRRNEQTSPSPFHAYLGTRLLSKAGALIGLLEIYSAASRAFDPEEIAFLEELAQLASQAINHSKVPLRE